MKIRTDFVTNSPQGNKHIRQIVVAFLKAYPIAVDGFPFRQGLSDFFLISFISIHPAHVEVADTKVRPYTEIRLCLDFCQ